MRYQLSFNLENERFPLDYRRTVISFIKKSLSEYDKETYENYYHEKDPKQKPFTFSIYFHNPKFETDKIILTDKSVELNISIADYSLAIIFYNSINHQRYKAFPLTNNTMTLKNITMLPEPLITTEQIKVKFMSPLVVRQRINNKDWYYSYSTKEKFEETLKMNIKEQLSITDIPTDIVNTFEIDTIQPKKAVVKFYEKQIEASLGTYWLKGDKRLLTFLYQCGMR